jgi:hypothetical protein
MSEEKRPNLASLIRQAITNLADSLHDATRWDQKDEAEGGSTPLDRLVSKIVSEIRDEQAAMRMENERLRGFLYRINDAWTYENDSELLAVMQELVAQEQDLNQFRTPGRPQLSQHHLIAIGKAASALRFSAANYQEGRTEPAKQELRNIAEILSEIESEHSSDTIYNQYQKSLSEENRQLTTLLYQFARHLRNNQKIPSFVVKIEFAELLTKLRERDEERYDTEVRGLPKPN